MPERMSDPIEGPGDPRLVRPKTAIRGIQIDDEAVEIVYQDLPTDFRAGGNLMASHVLAIRRTDDTEELVQDLLDAAQALLRDARQDFNETLPFTGEE